MKNTLKIYSSINDFAPLFGGLEYLFRGLKSTGIDGIELVVGVKSRWSKDTLKKLSTKYSLPIVALHQPVWSGLGLYFDEGIFKLAKSLKVKRIVFHPLSGKTLTGKSMRNYFTRLANLQKRYDIEVQLENLPKKYNIQIISALFPSNQESTNIRSLFHVAEEFEFSLVYDTTHANLPIPHKEAWFKEILPKVSNIHLSSFDKKHSHLPLGMGKFHTKEFMKYLEKEKYSKAITLEIYYPSMINPFSYNFSSIKDSVDYLRGK